MHTSIRVPREQLALGSFLLTLGVNANCSRRSILSNISIFGTRKYEYLIISTYLRSSSDPDSYPKILIILFLTLNNDIKDIRLLFTLFKNGFLSGFGRVRLQYDFLEESEMICELI